MRIAINSKRWVKGPTNSALRARINTWLIAHDPVRQVEIAEAEAEFFEAMQAVADNEYDSRDRSARAMERLLNA
jgi:hypothetical protein